MYIKREIEDKVLEAADSLPVITITGPRQSGKTTTIKQLFPNKKYYSLENPDNYELAKNDPVGLLDGLKDGAIFDEVQRVPELLSYIQEIVDNKNIPGMFILSGSQQFNLVSGITQSLAGRTALFSLLPFNISELGNLNETNTYDQLFRGFYPRLWSSKLSPPLMYSNYIETYIERDLRQLLNIKDLDRFRTFMRLCAGRIGQILIVSHIASELGVSVHTVNSWLSILETSYIVFQLQPWYSNINKRLTKARKLYFYDSGLACNLLRIKEPAQLESYPLFGSLFENLVIADIVKSSINASFPDNLYFYRDSNQNEIDLLIDNISSIDVVEVKSSQTFSESLLKSLNYIKKTLPNKVRHSYLCYNGKSDIKHKDHLLVNYRNISSRLIDHV